MEMNSRWYAKNLPGFIGIGFVVLARLMGVLQSLEWDALDAGLRGRSPELADPRIVIVGIDENDIQSLDAYPVPDGVIAQLLQRIQSYDPRAIGLDVVRDIPVEPGHDELVQVFQSMPNVIGATSVVPDRNGSLILPPPSLPSHQIGLVDAILDDDGRQRRSLLGALSPDGNYRLSMAIQLVMLYLNPEGIELGNGIRNPNAMRFGAVELPQVSPQSGGYVRADAKGNQTLIHFRSGTQPFQLVSLMDVLDDSHVQPDWFRDRIVLIGVTAKSTKDYAQSAAVNSSNPGIVFGVEIHAHVISQILSAVLDGRSLLRTWPDSVEYAWIVAWGLIGMAIGQWVQRPPVHFLIVGGMVVSLLGMSYASLLMGWWLPVIPALLVLTINGIVLHTIYLYNRSLQARIRDRQLVIEQTFTTIHNGPLQTLATVRQELDKPTLSRTKLRHGLSQLNQELRGIYDSIQKDATQDDRLHLQGEAALDLTTPLHEVLYEVYNDTLRRDFPDFSGLKVHVVKFEPFDETGLTSEHKRNLCRFLEESLCNVGKHATEARRLTIDCRHDGRHNVIRIVDNGIVTAPLPHAPKGRGTQQAKQLASQLGGKFERSPHAPKGTRCELTWLPQHPPWKRWAQHLTLFGKHKD